MYRAFSGSDYYEDSVTIGVSPLRPSRVPFDLGDLTWLFSTWLHGIQLPWQGAANQRNLMTNRSWARGFLPGRRGSLVIAVVATALVVFVACFLVWQHLRGDALRGVSVVEARLVAPKRVELLVATCHPPQVSLWERDVDLQVKAMSVSGPSRGDVICRVSVEFDLEEPLGDRAVVDEHTGNVVRVTTTQ